MPNLAAALKEEIARLARREINRETATLQNQSAQYRRDIAALKRDNTDPFSQILRRDFMPHHRTSHSSSSGKRATCWNNSSKDLNPHR